MRLPQLFGHPLHKGERSHPTPTPCVPHVSLNPQRAANALKENALPLCQTGCVSFGWDWLGLGRGTEMKPDGFQRSFCRGVA